MAPEDEDFEAFGDFVQLLAERKRHCIVININPYLRHLTLIESGSDKNFHKFRGKPSTAHGWLSRLVSPGLFSFISSAYSNGGWFYQNVTTRAQPAKPLSRPVGSRLMRDHPDLKALSADTVFYRKGRTWSLQKFEGAKEVQFRVKPGTEIYLKPASKTTLRGLVIGKDFWNQFQEKTTRFVAWTMTLKTSTGRHGNAMIYDRERDLVTRYEPHGRKTNVYDSAFLDAKIQEALVGKVANYRSPSEFCPEIGHQTLERRAGVETKTRIVFGREARIEAGGFCMAWSLYWIHVRIAHPNLTDDQVMGKISSDPKQLAGTIRRYMAAIVRETKLE